MAPRLPDRLDEEADEQDVADERVDQWRVASGTVRAFDREVHLGYGDDVHPADWGSDE